MAIANNKSKPLSGPHSGERATTLAFEQTRATQGVKRANNISKQNGNGDQSNHSVSDDMIANEILDMFGFDDEVIGITQEIMSRKDELIVAMRERITSLRRDDWKEGHSSHDNGSDNHNRSYQPGSQVSINVSSDKQFDKLKRSDMHFTTIEVLFLIYLS